MSGSNPGLVALLAHGLSVVLLQGPNPEGVPIGMPRGNGWHSGPTFVGTPLCPLHFQHTLACQWDEDRVQKYPLPAAGISFPPLWVLPYRLLMHVPPEVSVLAEAPGGNFSHVSKWGALTCGALPRDVCWDNPPGSPSPGANKRQNIFYLLDHKHKNISFQTFASAAAAPCR